jgi:ribonuclease HII
MRFLGIDEAGRGPLIGSMVVCGFELDDDKLSILDDLDVKDSKLLSPKKRELIFQELIKLGKYCVEIISAQEIDLALNDPKLNLNLLEIMTFSKIINKLKSDKIFIDSPSVNLEKIKTQVFSFISYKPEIVAENKADFLFKIVGAASIIAKVTRDCEIEKIKKKYNVDFGSGYPSDPKTKEFLKKYDNSKIPIFRTTWEPYKKIYSNSNKNKKNSNLLSY